MSRATGLVASVASVVAFAAIALPAPALAAIVHATLTDLSDQVQGEDRWRVEYALVDDAALELGGGIQIQFPLDAGLDPVGGSAADAGWRSVLLVQDPALLAPGALDNLLEGEPAAADLGQIVFIYTGEAETPSLDQPFEVYDAALEVVERGTIAVPEAGAGLTAIAAALALAGVARHRRESPRAAIAVTVSATVGAWAIAGGAQAEPVDGVVIHRAEVGALSIAFQPVTFERISQNRTRYRFDVSVTNNGATIPAPFAVSVVQGASATGVTERILAVPALAAGATALTDTQLEIEQNRQLPFAPERLTWCVPPPAGSEPQTDDLVEAIDAFITAQTQAGAIDKRDPDWREMLPAPPCYIGTGSYTWVMNTNQGAMRFSLFAQDAPAHTSSTVYLTRVGFYDGLGFHRVIQGSFAQGGDPRGDGSGGPGYFYGREDPNGRLHDARGALSMANVPGSPVSEGSQFFVTFDARPNLDGAHTVFGALSSGEAALDAIEARGATGDPGTPTEALTIFSAQIDVD